MKNRFFLLWVFCTLAGVALIDGASISDSKNSVATVIANMISLSPLIGLLLSLGSSRASRQFINWLHRDKNSLIYVAGGISFLFMLPGLLTGFNTFHIPQTHNIPKLTIHFVGLFLTRIP